MAILAMLQVLLPVLADILGKLYELHSKHQAGAMTLDEVRYEAQVLADRWSQARAHDAELDKAIDDVR